MSDERDRESSAGDHPLYELVGLLDADQASRVRERMKRFRKRLDERIER